MMVIKWPSRVSRVCLWCYEGKDPERFIRWLWKGVAFGFDQMWKGSGP